MTAVAQRQREQPRAAVFAGARIARRRALAVVDLHFLTGLGFEPATNLRIARSQLADEALYGVVGAAIAVMLDEVLVDRHGVAPLGDLGHDEVTMRLANAARSRRPGARHFRRPGTF